MSITVDKKYLEALLMNHSSLNQNKKALQKELNVQQQKHKHAIDNLKNTAIKLKSLEKQLNDCFQKANTHKKSKSPKHSTPTRRSTRSKKPPKRLIEAEH